MAVPAMFMEPVTPRMTASSPAVLMGMVHPMFWTEEAAIADVTPIKALPAKRGEIRKCFKKQDEKKCMINKDIKSFRPSVESAHTGNIRTTLRVKVPGSEDRQSWAEVTLKQHDNHRNIILEIAKAVKDGNIKSKAQARALKKELLK